VIVTAAGPAATPAEVSSAHLNPTTGTVMRSFVRTVTIALAFALLSLQGASAQPASGATKSKIDFAYIAPESLKYAPMVERLKQFRLLEQLSQFLSPLRLPHQFTMVTVECSAINAFYSPPEWRIVICYELIEMMERIAPKFGQPTDTSFQEVVVGGLVGAVVHELGHAVFDMLDVPVFGREEDAADQMALFIALQFNKDVARVVLKGFAYMSQNFFALGAPLFSDEHGTGLQRYYNALCLAYGGDPATFRDLVDKGDLPRDRAAGCPGEYQQVKASFEKTILPFVDLEQMRRVQSTPWLNLTQQQAALLTQQQQKPQFSFSVCNESKVTNAYASLMAKLPEDPQKWVVYGWFPIPDGACTMVGTLYGDRLYFYAMGTSGKDKVSWSAKDTDPDVSKQCVDPVNGFQLPAGSRCQTSQTLVNFRRIDADPLNSGLTFHLQ
jgi:hypothetical protein